MSRIGQPLIGIGRWRGGWFWRGLQETDTPFVPGQEDGEGRARSWFTADFDFTAMVADDSLHDHEPQP